MQLLELALVLPFLLVLSAGVMDFAQAWNMRQILANAAREGARYGSSQSPLDLSEATPPEIPRLCQVVADYLQQEHVDISFMNNTSNSGSSSSTVAGMCANPGTVAGSCPALASGGICVPSAWTYYSTGSYGLTIERSVPVAGSGGPATRVTLTYPYNWGMGFDSIVRIFGPSSYASTIPIPVYSTMLNLAN